MEGAIMTHLNNQFKANYNDNRDVPTTHATCFIEATGAALLKDSGADLVSVWSPCGPGMTHVYGFHKDGRVEVSR